MQPATYSSCRLSLHDYFLDNFKLKDSKKIFFENDFSKTKFGGQTLALWHKILTRATKYYAAGHQFDTHVVKNCLQPNSQCLENCLLGYFHLFKRKKTYEKALITLRYRLLWLCCEEFLQPSDQRENCLLDSVTCVNRYHKKRFCSAL